MPQPAPMQPDSYAPATTHIAATWDADWRNHDHISLESPISKTDKRPSEIMQTDTVATKTWQPAATSDEPTAKRFRDSASAESRNRYQYITTFSL